MSDAIPPILVQIQADIAGLKAGMEQAQKNIKGVTDDAKKASGGIDGLSKSMKQMALAAAAAFSIQAAKQFFKESIDAASDLNESLSKVQVVFGENSAAVIKWSQTAATAMGMSQQQAAEAAGTYGNLFRSFGLTNDTATKMSTTMVQLASDLASFNNASPEDTLLALRSALSGEYEPMKKFGVALNDTTLKEKALSMGLVETTNGVLPQAAKAQAAYALVMEKTKLAQGDYARTADGVANTQRTLTAQFEDTKAKIGAGLLPAYKMLLAVLQNYLLPALSWLGDLLAKHPEWIAAIATAIVVVMIPAVYNWAKATWAQASAQIVANAELILAVGIIAGVLVMIYKVWNASADFRAGMAFIAFSIVATMKLAADAIFWVVEKVTNYLLPKIRQVAAIFAVLPNPWQEQAKGILRWADTAEAAVHDSRQAMDSWFVDAEAKALSLKDKTFKIDAASTLSNLTKNLIPEIPKTPDPTKTTKDKKSPDAAILSLITSTKNKVADAVKAYNDKVYSLYETYGQRVTEAEQSLADARLKIQKEYDDAALQAEKDRSDKQLSVVRESIGRLRDAFRSGTETNVTELFKTLADSGTASADSLLASMKDRLSKIKALAQNASKLAAAGFSQTFIEQVVASGTDTGNAMSEAILSGDAQTISGLRDTFASLETLTAHGVDALSSDLYTRYGLATEALQAQYEDAQSVYETAMAKAEATRQQALLEAQAAYDAAIKKANDELMQGLADAATTLNDALDAAERNFTQKLATMKATLASTKAEIAGTYSLLGTSGVGTTSTIDQALAIQGAQWDAKIAALNAGQQWGGANAPTVNVTAVTNASAEDIAREAVLALTYGQPLSPAQTGALVRSR